MSHELNREWPLKTEHDNGDVAGLPPPDHLLAGAAEGCAAHAHQHDGGRRHRRPHHRQGHHRRLVLPHAGTQDLIDGVQGISKRWPQVV